MRTPFLRRALPPLATAAGGVLGLLGGLTAMEWWPLADAALPVASPPGASASTALPARLRLLTWNIGYGALDRGADFFMDGGRGSRARSAAAVRANLDAVAALLRDRAPDVALLQEVDRRASRSHRVDEVARLGAALPDYHRAFAKNYDTPWVPVPLARPMGAVRSGLATLARAAPRDARALALPGRQPWPDRLFHPKRVAAVLRLPTARGRDVAVVNVHLTAFDRAGGLRDQELAFVRALCLAEHARGHHVVAGGDWNATLPGAAHPGARAGGDDLSWLGALPPDAMPAGWTWATGAAPSVRTLGAPRNDRTTRYATVDGFLLSPGVARVEARTHALGFAHCDHEPVELTVALGDAP